MPNIMKSSTSESERTRGHQRDNEKTDGETLDLCSIPSAEHLNKNTMLAILIPTAFLTLLAFSEVALADSEAIPERREDEDASANTAKAPERSQCA